MIRAFAASPPRGCRWACLTIALAGIGPAALHAQDPKPGAPQPKAGAPQPKAGAPQAKGAPAPAPATDPAATAPGEPTKAAVAATAAEPRAKVEPPFVDPKAVPLLRNEFEPLFPRVAQANAQQIERMAKQRPDRAALKNFVQYEARVLTDRANLASLLDPDSNPAGADKIETATNELLDPLLAGPTPEFRTAYTAELVAVAPELLKNHLFARTEAMLVLSKTADVQALDTFLGALADPDQPAMVKLLAATGISGLVAPGSARGLTVAEADRAARALADFLEKEPETFWMAKVRALEALGTLRRSADVASPASATFATAALRVLSDPEARPEVRAWAAWALGMMEPPPAGPLNVGLIAHHAGRAAAELGEKIAGEPADQATYLTSFLAFPLHQGLAGQENLRGSGLANAAGQGAAAGSVAQITRLVGQVAGAAVTYSRAVGNQRTATRSALEAKVAELRAFLEKNAPKDDRLVPNGPAFPIAADQVADQ